MQEFPRDVVNLSYFSIPIIDLYYKLGEREKGNQVLATMIDDNIIEIKYLKEFKKGSRLKQNIGITSQVLSSLGRIIQTHKLEDPTYNYTSENGVYFKEKGESKEEIDYNIFRINTFTDEYLSIL